MAVNWRDDGRAGRQRLSPEANPLEILSETPAWNPPKRDITLRYRSGGQAFCETVGSGRPTYMDKMIVTARRQVRQWPRTHTFSTSSLRQFAKSSLRTVRRSVKTRLAATELDGLILDLRMLEPNNVAHMLLTLVPCCLYVQKVTGQPVTCLFRRTIEPFRTLATKFGVTPVFIEAPVTGRFVEIFGTRGLAVYDIHSVFDCEAMDFFPDTYAGFTPAVPPPVESDRLFLARRGARALANHKTVEDFLKARGYTTVYFEDYSVDQQCALGAAARDVVAIHGAAMSYFVLAPRMTSLIELLPPQVYHQIFAVALPRSIADYQVIVQSFEPNLAYQPFSALLKFKNSAFEADMALLEEAVGARR